MTDPNNPSSSGVSSSIINISCDVMVIISSGDYDDHDLTSCYHYYDLTSCYDVDSCGIINNTTNK